MSMYQPLVTTNTFRALNTSILSLIIIEPTGESSLASIQNVTLSSFGNRSFSKSSKYLGNLHFFPENVGGV